MNYQGPQPLWKITRDSFYGDLYQKHGFAFIEEAGFFFDSSKTREPVFDDGSILCTPLSFLKPIQENPCVLLSTGSFSPLHDGHLEMMIKAKETVENAGYHVLGGYLSPGHDEYIKAKTHGDWIPIHYRVGAIQRLIKERNLDWIQCDPWEGIFNKVAVNFTDVIHRLQLYLEKHLDAEIPVFYVCGGDNARFSRTFTDKGHCVVVNRPPYNEKYLKYLITNPDPKRILFCDADNNSSSTSLRRTQQFTTPDKASLLLRMSCRNPLEVWVKKRLEPRFSKIEVTYIEVQQRFQHLFKQVKPWINLDSELEIQGANKFQISRLYDLFGAHRIGYTNRPGSKFLEAQAEQIPAGEYHLFDDDIHTGNTVKWVTEFFKNYKINISETIALNRSNGGAGTLHSEILDARDFLFGISDNGGLVIKYRNIKTRMPYLYPYVCPYIRASIQDPLEFSIEMWELNRKIHEASGLLLADKPDLNWLFGKALGFRETTSLSEICHWHVQKLKNHCSVKEQL